MTLRFVSPGHWAGQGAWPPWPSSNPARALRLIPAAFGDAYAEKIMRRKLSDNPTHIAIFTKRLPKIRTLLDSVTDTAWFASMAAKQLHVLSTLTPPRGPTYPGFMQSEAFAAKNLESLLGSYTQLKHNTSLSAKPVDAQMGKTGEGNNIPPVAKGLVQPDLPFWREMERLTRFTADGFARHKLLPYTGDGFSRFRNFADDISTLRRIAEKQASGSMLTNAEWKIISTINFGSMARPFSSRVESQPDDGMCAIVTDIATDATSGQILFQALGRPLVMLALFGDKDGNRMVAGMAYNHHEFSSPISAGRLTNEQWRARIHQKSPPSIPRATWQTPLTVPSPAKSE